MPRLATVLVAAGFAAAAAAADESDELRLHYEEGLRIESADGRYSARFQLRGQFRFTTRQTDDDRPDPDEAVSDETNFEIRRARVKLGGHAYWSWLEYDWEQELADPALLDLQLLIQPAPQLGIRVGQYKVIYNRERVDSSGAQQFVERSIVNRAFTVDRQQGAALVGRLFAGTRFDSSYAIGLYNGAGRGGTDDDGRSMVVGRWQWNVLGRVLPFTQSDVARRSEPAASLAFAGAGNRSRFTRFSSAGGGQLEGFAPGAPGQYRLEQRLIEFALHYQGFSTQAEYHWKRIDDRLAGTRSELNGYYVQAGYFPHELWPAFPQPLELALRVARVDPDYGLPAQEEFSVGGNWFFAGHRNKLTLDVSRLRNVGGIVRDSDWRLRLQWDISI